MVSTEECKHDIGLPSRRRRRRRRRRGRLLAPFADPPTVDRDPERIAGLIVLRDVTYHPRLEPSSPLLVRREHDAITNRQTASARCIPPADHRTIGTTASEAELMTLLV
jgi:hypothetical protein